jgi:hypothetical protein
MRGTGWALVVGLWGAAAGAEEVSLLTEVSDSQRDGLRLGLMAQTRGGTEKVRALGRRWVELHGSSSARLAQLSQPSSKVTASAARRAQELSELRAVSAAEFDARLLALAERWESELGELLQKAVRSTRNRAALAYLSPLSRALERPAGEQTGVGGSGQ